MSEIFPQVGGFFAACRRTRGHRAWVRFPPGQALERAGSERHHRTFAAWMASVQTSGPGRVGTGAVLDDKRSLTSEEKTFTLAPRSGKEKCAECATSTHKNTRPVPSLNMTHRPFRITGDDFNSTARTQNGIFNFCPR